MAAKEHLRVPETGSIIVVVDVGANAVRLQMGRALQDGSIEIIHQDRDLVRSGRAGTVDLELWDVMREASLFRQVFHHRLRMEVA